MTPKKDVNYDQLERDWFEIENAVNSINTAINAVISQVNYITTVGNYGSVSPQLTFGMTPQDGAAAAQARTDHIHGTPPAQHMALWADYPVSNNPQSAFLSRAKWENM